MTELTTLLAAARAGDRKAAEKAFSLLYDDLRRLARSRLRQHRTMTLLDTTALVHESYLKLMGGAGLAVEDRHHFFAYAARVMRSVIVDFARRKQADRRGGSLVRTTVDVEHAATVSGEEEILCVHQALTRISAVDPRMTQVVEMRYFGGLTEPEIAQALGVTERTVRRDWHKARLLLREALAA